MLYVLLSVYFIVLVIGAESGVTEQFGSILMFLGLQASGSKSDDIFVEHFYV